MPEDNTSYQIPKDASVDIFLSICKSLKDIVHGETWTGDNWLQNNGILKQNESGFAGTSK